MREHVYSVGDAVHFWSEFYQAWIVDHVRKIDAKCQPTMFFVNGTWVNHSRLRPIAESCRDDGRRETLRLVYIAAACAEVFYDRLAERYAHIRYYDRERRDMYDFAAMSANETADATLRTLANLGDPVAAEMLKGRT